MPADPPCPDLDALEQALAGMTPGPWTARACAEGPDDVPREEWTSWWDIDADPWRGLVMCASASDEDEGNARGIAAAVNALPGLIAEVKRLRAALGEACDGWASLDYDRREVRQIEKLRATLPRRS